MPQLPSGRHVAIDPTRFAELIKNAAHFGNVHKVMAIDSIPALLPWLDVMYLVEPGSENPDLTNYELADSSFTPPSGFLALNTNCQLSQWEALAKDWSPEDQGAMQSFLSSERFHHFLNNLMHGAKMQQESFKKENDLLPKLLASWYAAGVHPAQEENWSEDDSPIWDTYDMLAALGDVVQYLADKDELYQLHLNIFDRATGMWQMLLSKYSFLREPSAVKSEVRAVAKLWRDANYLAELPDEKQQWIHQQMIIECMTLWNYADDVLTKHCPKAYDIMVLVTLSPEANRSNNS